MDKTASHGTRRGNCGIRGAISRLRCVSRGFRGLLQAAGDSARQARRHFQIFVPVMDRPLAQGQGSGQVFPKAGTLFRCMEEGLPCLLLRHFLAVHRRRDRAPGKFFRRPEPCPGAWARRPTFFCLKHGIGRPCRKEPDRLVATRRGG